ncbi:cytochrome ubiquinol oxidase subunit I [Ectobacillus polymachus]|uniref:cytochrome ubiquinol oxidase subunit I n=1 Tax=Ectobacillus polymachus TaxID=1508806 RepID=UPI003A841CE1
MNFDSVTVAKALTELSFSFHIMITTIGVGFPMLISFAEWIGIKKQDPHYILLARRSTRAFMIIVSVGVVSRTCIGLQLSLLWPSFMQLAGQAIGFPLFMDTLAFFLEIIFLGIYLYSWDRFKKPNRHWLLSIPIIIGSTMSAFFITSVSVFLDTPQGFRLVNGKIVDVQPFVAMLNPATPAKTFHVIVTSYLAVALILAAITATRMLGGRKNVYYQKALKLTMIVASLFSIGSVVTGDLSEKLIHPLSIHYVLDLKVIFAIYMVLISFAYVFILKYKREWAVNRYLLRGIMISGPLALVTIEMSWLFAAASRQPWIIRGYMKVSEAATTAPTENIDLVFVCFAIVYTIFAAISLKVMIKMFHSNPAELELEKPIEMK